ncbi:MAG: hypothetical protein DME49_03545 [Verrucomicrobia bacterium]|nr:MAG: hypothetical protein DME49_03545 [Verrucomicrobiota bacterium]PYL37327.1 MAG: hypothetical protein DMF34_10795 [Verrucomicrobiota bacterium]PYL55977.1 MAG: hypothetical protein DMF30_11305 [Verrucomicrobiota bacterium]
MAATLGGAYSCDNCIGSFAENGLQFDRQRGEEMLLRNTEGRKIPLQTHGQNARQVLLHGNVAGKAD